MKITRGSIAAEPHEHVVLTGPITGTVTTADGTAVDVTPAAVVASTLEEAAELAHLVGLRYDAEGHPDFNDDSPFVYEAPKQFADYTPHSDNPDSIAPTATKED